MKDFSYVFNAHPRFIEEMYQAYKNDASSVDEGWRVFFSGFDFGEGSASAEATLDAVVDGGNVQNEFAVLSIIHGFRDRGHLISNTNPVRQRKDRKAHLDIADYGLSESDLDKVFAAGNEIGMPNAKLRDIIDRLFTIYADNIGFEVTHIENNERRKWLRSKIEERTFAQDYGLEQGKKERILKKLNEAVIFEKFLHTKYVGQKRFSLEGGESTIAALDAIINDGANEGVEEVVIGMAHRGRLNVLSNIMGKTNELIFSEFEGTVIPDQIFGSGDVKYHLGYSSMVETTGGKTVHLKLVPNPSHLEAVDPVVQGFSRAKADILFKSDYDKILPILIHGDAAVVGQGVVYEVAQMSKLEGYHTGGTIHYVINNQIGFTTDFDDARSSTYCTAAGNTVQAPIFHVNGDDPEAVIFVVELAVAYRQKFNSDVFIDMVCYRKHGHNEGDDPKFTQPILYDKIKNHPNPREIYLKTLLDRKEITESKAKELEEKFWAQMQEKLDMVKEKNLPYKYQEPEQAWRKLGKTTIENDVFATPSTGVDKGLVEKLLAHLQYIPEEFNALSKVKRLQKGAKKLIDKQELDWALGELVAYGTILSEGRNVRMSGQDVKRGTFSHRHAVLQDVKGGDEYNRLSGISDDQGRFMIYNSLLSEFAVLGFEYGYSMASPESLVLWEAQFGDFYNGAQTMVDQFISSAESKWQRNSGLVILLPHGFEGQGPEHSSARVERWLQMCAEFNMIVTNITTPANLFHAFRRQLAADFRKPMVNMSPKSLLRHPKCISSIDDFVGDTCFQPIYSEDKDPKKVRRVLMCTGKMYYDLEAQREALGADDVVIMRVEQLYPLPEDAIRAELKKYSKADVLWVQEEPANMGYWDYLMRYFRRDPIELVARPAAASPATGFKKMHEKQQADILQKAFAK